MTVRRLRGIWGLLLLVGIVDPHRAAARVLGARHVAEVLLLEAGHDRRPPWWTVGVDLLHIISMVAIARRSPPLRREALVSALASSTLVALSLAERERPVVSPHEARLGPSRRGP